MITPGVLPTLQPMDIFHTRNPAALGRGINAFQALWSRDGKSIYSHSGYIVSSLGDTFEAVWKLEERNLFECYMGETILIVRWIGIPDLGIPGYLPTIFNAAHKRMKDEHAGQNYPWWRIPFHIIPPVAKYVSYKGHWIVCSETVSKMLWLYHLELKAQGYPCSDKRGNAWPRHHQYCGTNPDTLADEGVRWRGFEIIWEGILG